MSKRALRRIEGPSGSSTKTSLRLTGTVGLCLPVVLGCASSPVAEGLLRDALPNRAQEVAPPQIPVARGFGAGVV
jgi:hypothetical protein